MQVAGERRREAPHTFLPPSSSDVTPKAAAPVESLSFVAEARRRLEHEFQTELKLAGRPGAGDHSIPYILRARAGGAKGCGAPASRRDVLKLRVVEGVIGLQTELQRRVRPRQGEVLQQRHIPVVTARTVQVISS